MVVKRAGRLVEMTVPGGDLHVFVSPHRDGRASYERGRRRNPRWDRTVLEAYAAVEKADWASARKLFDTAIDAGLNDPNALWDAALSHEQVAAWGRAYELGKKALAAVDQRDRALLSERLTLWSFLLGMVDEAAAHFSAAGAGGRDVEQLRMIARLRATAPDQMRPFDAVPDIVGQLVAHTPGLGWWSSPKKPEASYELKRRWGFPAQLESLNYQCDFRLSMNVAIEQVEETRGRGWFDLRVNRGFQNRVLNMGLMDDGSLRLGARAVKAYGPLSLVKAGPELNSIVIQRAGARVDGFINGIHIATTFVSPADKVFVWCEAHCIKCRLDDIKVDSARPGE
jgi:hypothetical protein